MERGKPRSITFTSETYPNVLFPGYRRLQLLLPPSIIQRDNDVSRASCLADLVQQ